MAPWLGVDEAPAGDGPAAGAEDWMERLSDPEFMAKFEEFADNPEGDPEVMEFVRKVYEDPEVQMLSARLDGEQGETEAWKPAAPNRMWKFQKRPRREDRLPLLQPKWMKLAGVADGSMSPRDEQGEPIELRTKAPPRESIFRTQPFARGCRMGIRVPTVCSPM
ncbi:unnamed protein product [Prorocentrum cordatum]|uniref:Uncharacterized protein n=1 Tax=Prorocentrum cordatum TaxID=2364126 RepID=A0ABN9XBK0_9DINO|nr:unnamed protein product [Polarella glacialis]